MSRVPTNASEAGTQISIGALDGMGDRTGLTPSGMGLGDFGLAVTGSSGVSGLRGGLGIGMNGFRNQEEEKKRKIETIVSDIGTRWGRVCPEGVERAAKRIGLECLWEEGRGGAKRTLSIAGNDVLVDVEFVGEEVQGVHLELAASGQEVGKRAPEGAEVLKKDLSGGEDGSAFLDAFVANLEKLARLDKLAEGGVSCFDAIEGLRSALERVFEWQLGKKREQGRRGIDNILLERQVLCQGTGRPKIHTRARVGLAVQYWTDRKLLPPKGHEPGTMDIDTTLENPEDDVKIYSAVLECETLAGALYPPIRVSNDWISESIEKSTTSDLDQSESHEPKIDWQEPPPTILKSSDESSTIDAQDPLLQERTPNVRFVARFEPPIVVPLQTAINIHQAVGSPLLQDAIQSTTYEALLFADTTPSADQRTATKTVTAYGDSGNAKERMHQYTLFPTQSDYGHVMHSIPFAHPRQIIELLPTLRQWALLGSLLRRSLAPESPRETAKRPTDDEAFGVDFHLDESMTVEEELAALLASDTSADIDGEREMEEATLPIDITLATSLPTPWIGIMWPQGEKRRNISFGVGLNGAIEVHHAAEDENAGREKTMKILEISEDLGTLVEWMKKET